MEIKKGIRFDDGTELYCYADILGLMPDGTLTYGYDGYLNDHKLTDSKRIEIADYMIKRWKEYKKNLTNA